jgi:hypothetical protein
MNRNMSNLDRGIRALVVAPALIVVAILLGAGSVAGIVLFALAAIMLATSAVGFCPLYTAFHIATRRHSPIVHSH